MYLPAALYVRILPIDKQVQQAGKDKEGIHTQPHSTFFIQSLFFLLVLAENLLLALWPLIKGQSNRALACLGPEKLVNYVWIVAGLWAIVYNWTGLLRSGLARTGPPNFTGPNRTGPDRTPPDMYLKQKLFLKAVK